MDLNSQLRMQWFVDTYLNKQDKLISVLDVGSYDVNGSYKYIFSGPKYSYLGLDMEKGPNVDFIPSKPYSWTELENDSFDVVISGQALEHIEFFWVTMAEIARVLRPGGLLCLIVPRGFDLHRYPVDCYRFDVDGVIALARYCNLRPLHASTNMAPKGAPSVWYTKEHAHCQLVAQKPHNWKGLLDPTNYVFQEAADIVSLATGFISEEEARLANQEPKILRGFAANQASIELAAIKGSRTFRLATLIKNIITFMLPVGSLRRKLAGSIFRIIIK